MLLGPTTYRDDNTNVLKTVPDQPIRPIVTGPDPDTLPGSPEWSRLVKFHCTIPREDKVELQFKEGSKHMH